MIRTFELILVVILPQSRSYLMIFDAYGTSKSMVEFGCNNPQKDATIAQRSCITLRNIVYSCLLMCSNVYYIVALCVSLDVVFLIMR